MSHDEFHDRGSHMGRWVSCIFRHAHIFFSKEMEKYGLGSGQFLFLRVLMFNEGVNQSELSSMLNIDKATTARAIRRLAEKGYVLRHSDRGDGRSYRLYMTDSGRKIALEIRELGKRVEEMLTEGFSDEEKKTLLSLLERAAKNAGSIKSVETLKNLNKPF